MRIQNLLIHLEHCVIKLLSPLQKVCLHRQGALIKKWLRGIADSDWDQLKIDLASVDLTSGTIRTEEIAT